MSAAHDSPTTLIYRPALAWFAALGSAWVFVLVTLGAFTTSIGAGMAFADWPLSNGSLNPDGWLSNIMMFAEHSHRLTGTVMGLITLGLAVWLSLVEKRRWVRTLGWSALGIVVIQGVIGGQRVKLDAFAVPGFEMTLGQMLRIPHGILAQVYVCVLFAIAAAVSRSWIEHRATVETTRGQSRLRRLARTATALLFLQLIVAAVMRHNAAGLAIPTFPLTPEGGLVPHDWNFAVGIHFIHRLMAVALTVALPWLMIAVWRERDVSMAFKNLAATTVALLAVQIALGATVIWSGRNPYFTTAHVIVGACTLATTFLLTWLLHRDAFAPAIAPAADAGKSASKRKLVRA